MKVVGITGGVGSGKSMVLAHLKEAYHGMVYELDQVAKDLQRKGTSCYEEIVQCFGSGILAKDGELDRKHLAEIVFSTPEKLEQLNHIVHPAVTDYVLQEIEGARNTGVKYFFIEAALLLENDYDAICDELWYIHTSESVRRERLKASRGYTDHKIDEIIASQLPEEVFFQRCDYVIENSGDFEETKRQIGELLS